MWALPIVFGVFFYVSCFVSCPLALSLISSGGAVVLVRHRRTTIKPTRRLRGQIFPKTHTHKHYVQEVSRGDFRRGGGCVGRFSAGFPRSACFVFVGQVLAISIRKRYSAVAFFWPKHFWLTGPPQPLQECSPVHGTSYLKFEWVYPCTGLQF